MSISAPITESLAVIGSAKWGTKQEHLNHSTGNVLFIVAIVVTITLNAWMTRGIRNFRDVTTCCALAMGMTPLTVVYFILGNVMINGGLGMNKNVETCAMISTTMMSTYFLLKTYMGFFFFKKLREIVDMVTNGHTRTSRRSSAKGSFYYVFPPLLIVFLFCAIFSVSSIETSLKLRDIPRPGKKTFCIFAISHSYLTVSIFAFLVTATSAAFTLSFLCSSPLFARNTRHHPGSPAAGTAALLSAIIPFISSVYLLSKGGRESASLVNLACAVDVAVMHVLVWAAEGQWSMESAVWRGKVCKCFRLPSQMLDERSVEERRRRVMEVRELQRAREMDEKMLLKPEEGEGIWFEFETINLDDSDSDSEYGYHHYQESSAGSSARYSSSPGDQTRVERGYMPWFS